MNIWYRNSAVFLDGALPEQWMAGVLINSNTAIQNVDSTYLSVQPDGTQQTRTVVGPWEECTLNPSNNTVTYSGTGLSYVIPIRGR